jgi:hypothetical protein
MQISVTEFKRGLKVFKFADEPIHITKRGRFMGVYVSEIAKAKFLAEEEQHGDSLMARGFTPQVMADIKRQAAKAQV